MEGLLVGKVALPLVIHKLLLPRSYSASVIFPAIKYQYGLGDKIPSLLLLYVPLMCNCPPALHICCSPFMRCELLGGKWFFQFFGIVFSKDNWCNDPVNFGLSTSRE
ncbi:hypothetical protein NE237_026131 [Protea cynaroides]|uniref:Uncharacterized protein n=1 Tax=Protea cynaroides TaxID=273540 RepID=A0A9Q0H6H3_9MAGN|nr:hypothetical protein NE237_026131 [Protea cynaroides]